MLDFLQFERLHDARGGLDVAGLELVEFLLVDFGEVCFLVGPVCAGIQNDFRFFNSFFSHLFIFHKYFS